MKIAAVIGLLAGSVVVGCLVPGVIVGPSVSFTPNPAAATPAPGNPVITSITANPTSLRAGDKLSVFVEAVSSSGRTLTYSWSTTGGTLSATSGKVIYWTAPTKAGSYTVTASVTDGLGGQAVAGLNILVAASGEATVSSGDVDNSGTGNSTNFPPTPSPPPPAASWAKVQGLSSVKDIAFVTPDLGWATVGKTITHTTDGGITWVTQWEGTQSLGAISFVDAKNGWAVGDAGTLLRTTDEGKTWTLVDWAGAGTARLVGVAFKDLSEGLLADGGSLYRSTDGGVTWSLVSEASSGWFQGEPGRLQYFSNGIAFFGAYRWRSNISKTLPVNGSPAYYLYYGSIAFPDSENANSAWATMSGPIAFRAFKTSDGGLNWKSVDKLNIGTQFLSEYEAYSISFANPSEGMMTGTCAGKNCTLATIDRGETWHQQLLPSGMSLRGNKFRLFDSSHGINLSGGTIHRLAPPN